MNPDQWKQIDELAQAAIELNEEDRASFLDEACRGDAVLRREVEALIGYQLDAGSFLEAAAIQDVGQLITDTKTKSLAGQTIAHYKIENQIGSGGMGEVYLAKDTRLRRRVALKLLPDSFTRDETRLRRFQQEARAASALSHPNIITIHDIGEMHGRYFITMEYIDGETLRDKIHDSRAPLAKLLNYLQQVAEGLTKAHAAGIVHRDLKPDNIMITRDGYAKVFDFGLAKLVAQPQRSSTTEPSEAVTAVVAQTSIPGMVMGSLGYMSPEQAQGKTGEIDHRSDIFSFGCILYEAATGRKAFDGSDLLDSLHKIVHAATPQIKEVNSNAPDDLERIVRRCLAKDPEKRYQSIKDVAIDLEDLQKELDSRSELEHSSLSGYASTFVSPDGASEPSVPTTEVVARTTRTNLTGGINRLTIAAVFVVGVLIVLAMGALFFFRWSLTGESRISNPGDPFQSMKLTRLTTTGKAAAAAISPDGKLVAYLNLEGQMTGSIWIRQIATSRDIRIVEPGQFIYGGLAFSPDGNYLYYSARSASEGGPFSTLFRVSVLGGEPTKLTTDVYSKVSFSPDSKRIAFVRNNRQEVGKSYLVISNADATDERIISTHDLSGAFAYPGLPIPPAWSPDGQTLACAVGQSPASLIAVQIETGSESPIGVERWRSILDLAWLSDGNQLAVTGMEENSLENQLWLVAYPSGERRRVTNDLNSYRGMSLTADSSTAAVVQTETLTDVWIAPDGKVDKARQITSGAGRRDGSLGLSWTPDGRVVFLSNAGGKPDLWSIDVNGGGQKQLTADTNVELDPQVTPDGRYIVFLSEREGTPGLWRMDSDGRNFKLLVLLRSNFVGFNCSPDGKWIVYNAPHNNSVPALWKVSIEGGEPILLSDQYWSELPVFSPDGKQIAFQYWKTGTPAAIGLIPIEGGEITPVAPPPTRIRSRLRWSPDGKSIAYVDTQRSSNIWAIPISGGSPKQLTEFTTSNISIALFDWSPDGKQLALARGTRISDVVLVSGFK